jgi:hypothetical protein
MAAPEMVYQDQLMGGAAGMGAQARLYGAAGMGPAGGKPPGGPGEHAGRRHFAEEGGMHAGTVAVAGQ